MTSMQSIKEVKETNGAAKKSAHVCGGATDRLSGIALASLFVWGGVVLLAVVSGLVAKIPASEVNGWTIFLLGGGLIATVEILIRLVSKNYAKPQLINYIAVAFFFGVGLGVWWAFMGVALLAIGASIARDTLRHRNGSAGDGPSY